MKRYIFAISYFFLAAVANHSLAQTANSISSLEGFLKNRGVKSLGQCAHALNTYSEGTYSVEGSYITVEVSYTNGTSETIRCHYERDGDYFDNVRSINGDEMAYSFVAAKTLLDLLLPTDRERECIEKFFRTSFRDMSGQQLAAAALTGEWWDWNGKSCPNY